MKMILANPRWRDFFVLKRRFEEMDNGFDRVNIRFDLQGKRFEESQEIKNYDNQRPAGLQLQAQQSRFVVKGDVFQDKKTRQYKEGDASDKRLGDILSVRVDDNPMSQSCFGNEEFIEPPALTVCSDNTLVNVGDEAPSPRLSQVTIRTITPASDLLHIGLVSTMLKTLFPPHHLGASVKILN